MDATPIDTGDARPLGGTGAGSIPPRPDAAAIGALALKWSALHDAADTIATVAGMTPLPISPEARAFPVAMADVAGWRRALAEQQIDDLTALQESDRPAPWSVADAPPDFVTAQLKGIAGVEVPVDRIEGKWKASQNQPAANRAGALAGLREQDPASPMAAAMDR